jgi:hypothetical protein
MRRRLGLCLLLTAAFIAMGAARARSASREEIGAFTGILALWAEDGVDLMPDEAPIVGRKAILAWVEGVLQGIAGYKVTKEELEFHDIQVTGGMGLRVGNGTSDGPGP